MFARHRCLGLCLCVVVVVVALCILGGAAQTNPRPPYTTPVIQTAQESAAHPETGAQAAVLPVHFTAVVAEPFLTPAVLQDGTRSTGAPIGPEYLFSNATLRLTFDVPNPGLDFVLNLTSAEYPLLRDPSGTLWKPVLPSRIEVVKQNTKYTYDVGNIGVSSYQSKSEAVEVVAGAPAADVECYTTKACCQANATHYRKFELVDSPVPPYVCTGAPVPYQLRYFAFDVNTAVKLRAVEDGAVCRLTAKETTDTSFTCSADPTLSLGGVAVNPSFNEPSRAFALCRQGDSLTQSTGNSLPIPVVSSTFCSTNRCIGYTAANYRADRSQCMNYPLGYYTSADRNNTNQFSFYERNAAALWPIAFVGCKWIDDVTMSSPSTIRDISFQCDVPASTGWSLSYANFSAHLTDTMAPLFPIGRPTRVSGRYVSPTDSDTILFEVEYVSFSSFTATSWTLRVCMAARCVTPTVPVAGDTGHYPRVMQVNVSASALGIPASSSAPAVTVEVYSATTPRASPFRTLLAPSTVVVEAAAAPLMADTVNLSLAFDPPEHVLPPYAAATGGRTTSRVLCAGDLRFSTNMDGCWPLKEQECIVKYHGRRRLFNATAGECAYAVPLLDGPLQFVPLAEPPPPHLYTPEEIRAILTTTKLPQFLRTMEKTYAEYERKVAQRESRAVPLSRERTPAAEGVDFDATAAATAYAAATAAESGVTYINEFPMPGTRALTITCIVLTCSLWTVTLLRDVLCKLFAIGPWSGQPRCVLVDGVVRGCQRLRLACARPPKPRQPSQSPTSTTAVAAPSTSQSTRIGGDQSSRPTRTAAARGRAKAAVATRPPQTPSRPAEAVPCEPFTPTPSHSASPAGAPLQQQRKGGKRKQRRSAPQQQQDQQDQQQPRQDPMSGAGRRRSTSPWGSGRQHACRTFSFAEGSHAPFDGPGRGGDGQDNMNYAPHASPRPRSAASPRWYSHPTSPFPGSCPPSPHQRAFEDGRAPAPPPYYASYDVPLPDAMPFPPFAGFDAFPPGSPARQSSRVEVLSSDTDGGHDTGASAAAAAAGAASASVPSRAGRARRLNSID